MSKKLKIIKSVLTSTQKVKVIQRIGWCGSGCHGYQILHPPIEIPGWDLPPGTELQVDTIVTVLKRAKPTKKRCENPWPSHTCNDGIHCGAFGKHKVPRKKHEQSRKTR
jgi:hypothetical protein